MDSDWVSRKTMDMTKTRNGLENGLIRGLSRKNWSGGPVLVTESGPGGPIYVDQTWSGRTSFSIQNWSGLTKTGPATGNITHNQVR